MLVRIVLACCFAGFFFNLQGQMIDHSTGELFAEDPTFNVDFIRQNKIKSIKGNYATKADLDKIRTNRNVYVYEFSQKGQLTKDYKTIIGDTIVRMYEYDDKGNLLLIRKTDRHGFHSYHYSYDSLDRILSKEYRRDLNKSYNKTTFELGQSFIISKQTFGYKETKEGTKKLYYNTSGRIYKTELFYKDENGYLIKQEARSMMGSGTDKVEYIYNSSGLLKEKKTTSYLTNNNTTKIKYEYDQYENILAQHYYRNKVYKTEYQIVYDSETFLLSALLSRDIETNIITILKFSEYSYYD